jgi:hypothetical protein
MTSYSLNKNGEPEYGRVTHLDKHKHHTILKQYTDAILANTTKRLKKDGITVKFADVKRNDKNEITGINISAKSKGGNAVNLNLNSDRPINPIAISYYGDGNGLSIGPSPRMNYDNTLTKKDTTINSWETSFKIGKPFSDLKVIGYRDSISRIKVRQFLSDTINKSRFQFETTQTDMSKALFLIDGKEATEDDMKNLDSSELDSMTVLKDKMAIEKYGNKGKNGVVEITTKK